MATLPSRLSDDDYVMPIDLPCTEYQEYLEWIAEGNTPEPADQLLILGKQFDKNVINSSAIPTGP